MIKKLIGIIVAVAVVVIIVVAAIRRDNFQSMVRRDELLNGVEPAAEPPHLISPPNSMFRPKALRPRTLRPRGRSIR